MSGFKDLGLSYTVAAHGLQSAIAFQIAHELQREFTMKNLDGIRKHLRVGIDSAHSSHAALVEILIGKGIITRKEYDESVRLLMNNELAIYEDEINATYNTATRLSFR